MSTAGKWGRGAHVAKLFSTMKQSPPSIILQMYSMITSLNLILRDKAYLVIKKKSSSVKSYLVIKAWGVRIAKEVKTSNGS